jgi:arginine decarboxylase-like protein
MITDGTVLAQTLSPQREKLQDLESGFQNLYTAHVNQSVKIFQMLSEKYIEQKGFKAGTNMELMTLLQPLCR